MSKSVAEYIVSARRECGLTQEAAAERLHMSVRTLQNMEYGVREVDRVTLGHMVDIYCKPMLAMQYVHADASIVGMGELIPTEGKNLPLATIAFVNAFRRFAESAATIKLLEIAEDGKISSDERETFEAFCRDFEPVVREFLTLRCAGEVE